MQEHPPGMSLIHLYRISIPAPNCGTVQINFSEVHFALREKRTERKTEEEFKRDER